MNVTIDDRLRCMAQTLQDVVMPAIDPGNAKAAEEAQFLLYHLKLIREQADREFHAELAELRHFAELADELLECAPAARAAPIREHVEELLRDSAPLGCLQLPRRECVRDSARRLREASDEMLKAALRGDDAAWRAEATRIVMTASARQITRDRVWAKSAGLDFEAETLPGFDAVFGGDAS